MKIGDAPTLTLPRGGRGFFEGRGLGYNDGAFFGNWGIWRF